MNGCRLMVATTWIVLPTSTGGLLNRLMLAATPLAPCTNTV
jgi:hypothetical protein